MARSQRLRNADVRAVIRLVREVCELGEDGRAWRLHMLRTLNELIGACAGVCYLHALPIRPGELQFREYLDTGTGPEWERYIRTANCVPDPVTPAMLKRVGRTCVQSREQLCADRDWYESPYFREVRAPLRMDESLTSLVVLPRHIGGFSCLGFGRTLGMPPFGRRERTALHLFHTELAELWRTPARGVNGNGNGNGAAHRDLSPRLRQTLALLHEGLSEKQVALRVGLSPHTVHDYVKELHRRFDAATTTELVVRTRPAPLFRPALALA
jgi:DNA-binding CsgD family transcriptional regulator